MHPFPPSNQYKQSHALSRQQTAQAEPDLKRLCWASGCAGCTAMPARDRCLHTMQRLQRQVMPYLMHTGHTKSCTNAVQRMDTSHPTSLQKNMHTRHTRTYPQQPTGCMQSPQSVSNRTSAGISNCASPQPLLSPQSLLLASADPSASIHLAACERGQYVADEGTGDTLAGTAAAAAGSTTPSSADVGLAAAAPSCTTAGAPSTDGGVLPAGAASRAAPSPACMATETGTAAPSAPACAVTEAGKVTPCAAKEGVTAAAGPSSTCSCSASASTGATAALCCTAHRMGLSAAEACGVTAAAGLLRSAGLLL